MDINTLRGISTVVMFIAFIGLCWWAFSRKQKTQFDEAANLPFEDESLNEHTLKQKDGHGDNRQ